jgi:hypothetical protein
MTIDTGERMIDVMNGQSVMGQVNPHGKTKQFLEWVYSPI